jgi:hypothetical protein
MFLSNDNSIGAELRGDDLGGDLYEHEDFAGEQLMQRQF